MNAPVIDTDDAAHRPACPHCKGAVVRIPRRFIDRLSSIFVPVRRFQCRSLICCWEGNLRNSWYFLPEAGRGESYGERYYVLEASRRGAVAPTAKPRR